MCLLRSVDEKFCRGIKTTEINCGQQRLPSSRISLKFLRDVLTQFFVQENIGSDFLHVNQCNVPQSMVSTFIKYVTCPRDTVYRDPISVMQTTFLQITVRIKLLVSCITCIRHLLCEKSQIPNTECYLMLFPDDDPLQECSAV